MTPEKHGKQIGDSVKRELVAKYIKGQQEHGGHLWEIPTPLINDMAIEEAIDQAVYLKTMQQQLKLLKEWLTELFRSLENPIEEQLGEDELTLIQQIKELMGL